MSALFDKYVHSLYIIKTFVIVKIYFSLLLLLLNTIYILICYKNSCAIRIENFFYVWGKFAIRKVIYTIS